MTRKSILLAALTACIAATAVLTAPPATAGSNAHYDCTQRHRNIYKSRMFSAKTMITLNHFLDYAEDRYNKAIEDIQANEGDPAVVNLLSTDATKEIVWDLEYLHHRLRRLERRVYRQGIRRCPALFGSNIAQINKARNTAAARAAELRDLLDDAVDMYADGYPL